MIDSNEGYSYQNKLHESDVELRLGFVRKVYGILTVQLLITAGFCVLPYTSKGAQNFMVENNWLLWVCFAVAIALICALFCIKSLARTVPTNYILMFMFTAVEAYTVGAMCAMVNDS
jgi:FtsH-binding integral membrane protein